MQIASYNIPLSKKIHEATDPYRAASYLYASLRLSLHPSAHTYMHTYTYILTYIHTRGGDLGGLGGRSPQRLRWGDGPCIGPLQYFGFIIGKGSAGILAEE